MKKEPYDKCPVYGRPNYPEEGFCSIDCMEIWHDKKEEEENNEDKRG